MVGSLAGRDRRGLWSTFNANATLSSHPASATTATKVIGLMDLVW